MKTVDRVGPTLIAAAIALAALAGAPRPAVSQTGPPLCGVREVLAELLRRNYGELLRVRASEEGGRLLEFYVAPSGSWTMIVSRGSVGCVGAAGTEWVETQGKEAERPEM